LKYNNILLNIKIFETDKFEKLKLLNLLSNNIDKRLNSSIIADLKSKITNFEY